MKKLGLVLSILWVFSLKSQDFEIEVLPEKNPIYLFEGDTSIYYKADILILSTQNRRFEVKEISVDKGKIKPIHPHRFELTIHLPTKGHYRKISFDYQLSVEILVENQVVPITKSVSFSARRPEIEIHEQMIPTLYQNCSHLYSIGCEDFEKGEVIVSGVQNAKLGICSRDGYVITAPQSGKSILDVSVIEGEKNKKVGSIHFNAASPPLPFLQVFTAKKELQNGDSIAKGTKIGIKIAANPCFNSHPADAVYGTNDFSIKLLPTNEILYQYSKKDSIIWFKDIKDSSSETGKYWKYFFVTLPENFSTENGIIMIEIHKAFRKNYEGKNFPTEVFNRKLVFFVE